MAPPKDIARSYPKRGLTADVGFRSEPKFCGDGSVELDGSNQYLATTLGSALGETFTVSCWVYRSSAYSGFDVIWETGTFGANASLRPAINNTAEGLIDLNDNASFMTSTIGVGLDRWAHVVICAIAGAGNTKIYVDGVDATPASHSVFVNATNALFEIGRYIGNNHYLTGNVSDVRIYDQTLTQDQVREIYNNPGLAIPTGLSASNLIHRYKLETNYEDTGTGGNDLTAYNSPSFTVNRPQLPRGLDLARGAAMARVYTGRCVDFDGSADRITAAHYNPSGDFLTTTVWFNADTIRNQGITHNGNLGRNSFLFYMGASNNIQFYWNDTTGDALITHQSSLTTGQWHHLAMVLDMSDPADHQATCYIDGVAATGTRVSATWYGDNTYQFGNQYSTSGWFDGKIADCRIYDVALTQAQIRELYHNPEQVLPTGVSASNLRRYYPLSDYNDATAGGMGGRYFQDMGADGEPAEDKGSSSMAFAQPVPCPQLGLQQSATRLLFPGGTTTHNAVATTAALGTNASVSCWFQCNNPSPVGIIWSVGLAGTNHWYTYIQSGKIIIGPANINIGTVTEGAWTHLVVTTDSGSPPYKAYVNGAEVSLTGTHTARNLTSGSFEIGNQDVASTPFVFTGILNDVACWNTELSLSDAQSLYNSGVMGMDVGTVQASNLKGWWKCDDLTTLKDYSGNGANATVTGTFAAASFPENASGSTIVGDFSLKRKGVSVLNFAESANAAEAVIPAESSLFPNAIGYTISVWVKGRRSSNAGYVIRSATTTTLDRVAVATQTSNEWLFEFPRISGSSTYIPCPLTYDGEWHCMTATIDSATNTIKAYTDGILQATLTTSVVNTAATPSDISINPDVSTYWSGVPVALLKISQQTWTDDEVQRNYYSDLRLIKGLANE